MPEKNMAMEIRIKGLNFIIVFFLKKKRKRRRRNIAYTNFGIEN
jgi:hypothetical protein